LAPLLSPVTPDVPIVGVVMEEVPVNIDQVPNPIAGFTAFNVAVDEQTDWSAPATAAEGNGLTNMFKVLEDDAQTPLEIVHTTVLVPVIKLVTDELFKVGVVILDPPAITVHIPVPTIGALPVKVEVEVHKFCDGPVVAIVGTSFTSIVIVEILGAQGELEIVQAKTFVPIARPVMVELGKVGEVIVPEPETSVHNPVPTVGVLAVIIVVGEEIQSVWDAPAFARVGTSFTSIVIVEILGAQGEFEIVQAKTLVPIARPVIVEFGKVGEVIVPEPETSVHNPVPTVGVLAVIVVVGEEIQSV